MSFEQANLCISSTAFKDPMELIDQASYNVGALAARKCVMPSC